MDQFMVPGPPESRGLSGEQCAQRPRTVLPGRGRGEQAVAAARTSGDKSPLPVKPVKLEAVRLRGAGEGLRCDTCPPTRGWMEVT